MKRSMLLAMVTAIVAVSPRGAAAQADSARIVLGVAVSTSGTDRDTLGLLVSTVTPGSLADREGIAVGNRLSEINGVSLRIAQADIGRRQAQDGAVGRLGTVLRAVQPGDSVALRVYGGGRWRTVTIHTPKAAAEVRADVPPVPARAATTLSGIVDGIVDLRTQLNRLIQCDSVAARRDTLMRAQLDLGAIETRLRAAQA